MQAGRSAPSNAKPASRQMGLRALLILVVVLLGVYVLPSPWAFHIGGRFSPAGEWDGYGAVQASNGGHYLLYTHLRAGLVNSHGQGGCSFAGCDTLTGTAQLCTQGGQHDTFVLTGAVHTWYSTNGARTDISLTAGTPKPLPKGSVIEFHGTWRGAVLPVAATGGSFTRIFTPAGTIRAAATADRGTAAGTLRAGPVTSFDRACRLLAGQTP